MKAISLAAILVALTLASAPAVAGQRQRQPRDGQSQAGRAVPRGEAPSQPPPAASAPAQPARAPARGPAQAPRVEPQRTEPRRSDNAPDRADTGLPRRSDDVAKAGRSNGSRPAVGRAVPRTEPPRRFDNDNRGYSGSRFDNRPRGNRPIILAPRYYNSGRYFSPPYRGYRPYYFRPRTRLPYFGMYLGYSVPYSYVYSSPVYVYGYGRPATPVLIGPGSSYYGGVSLEIAPGHAEVFVDGEYVGWVEDFDGTMQPLTLTPGTHRIEIFAPGHEPLILDVVVRPGEVVPYRGSLQPYRY